LRKGFTLVELSIVLVIIGLLIGGILAAQSMVDSARAQKLIKEVEFYQIQTRLFRQTFYQLPGDHTNALNIFGVACNNGGSGCNGNGDGRILSTGVPNSGRYEESKFWHHLYLAGFLKVPYGVTYVAGSTAETPIGRNIPQLEYHPLAGLKLEYGGAAWFGGLEDRNYFVIGGNVTSYYQSAWLRPGIIKPLDALNIDSKIDDKIPNNGSVRAFNAVTNVSGSEAFCFPASASVGGTSAATASAYNLTHKEYKGGCVLRIALDDY
jgi:prepilin-type N-terminal cleavage/methylation domain-containing protein